MPGTVRCPHCGINLKYGTPDPPARARCPKCKAVFPTATEPQNVKEAAKPSAKPVAGQPPEPSMPPSLSEENEFHPEPVQVKGQDAEPTKHRPELWVTVLAFAVFMFAAYFGVPFLGGFFGYKEDVVHLAATPFALAALFEAFWFVWLRLKKEKVSKEDKLQLFFASCSFIAGILGAPIAFCFLVGFNSSGGLNPSELFTWLFTPFGVMAVIGVVWYAAVRVKIFLHRWEDIFRSKK